MVDFFIPVSLDIPVLDIVWNNLYVERTFLTLYDELMHMEKIKASWSCLYSDEIRPSYQVAGGLSTKDAETRYDKLGPNEVPFKPESFRISVAEEMFTLFRVYQFLIYSIWLWFAYLFVGALLFSVVLIAAAITIRNRRQSQFAISKVRECTSSQENH